MGREGGVKSWGERRELGLGEVREIRRGEGAREREGGDRSC